MDVRAPALSGCHLAGRFLLPSPTPCGMIWADEVIDVLSKKPLNFEKRENVRSIFLAVAKNGEDIFCRPDCAWFEQAINGCAVMNLNVQMKS